MIAGASTEFVGIILVGSPDFAPYASRVSRWLSRTFFRAAGPILRRVGIRHNVVIRAEAAGAAAVGGRVSTLVTVNPEATSEEKIEFFTQTQRGGSAGRQCS